MEPGRRLNWRKASYSTTNGGACVEVANELPGAVAVRDTTDRDGPVLVIGGDAWMRFLASI